jgi:hypothetical protein
MNRMQYVNEGGTNKLLAQYSWDALSRAQSIAYGDGTSDAYSQYDAGDNLQTLTQTYIGLFPGGPFEQDRQIGETLSTIRY